MVVLAVATVVMVTLTAVFTQPLTFAAYAPLHLQHPLLVGHWFAIVIGAAFFTAFARRVATEISASSDALSPPAWRWSASSACNIWRGRRRRA